MSAPRECGLALKPRYETSSGDRPRLGDGDRRRGVRTCGDARGRRSSRRVVVDRGDPLAERYGGPAGLVAAAAGLCVYFRTAAERRRRGRLAGMGADDRADLAANQRPVPGCRVGRLVVARSGASRGRSALARTPICRPLCVSPHWTGLPIVRRGAAGGDCRHYWPRPLPANSSAGSIFTSMLIEWIGSPWARRRLRSPSACGIGMRRFVLAGEYVLGLSAVGMALCASTSEPRLWCWWAASALPAFAMAAAVLGWLLPRIKPLARLLRIPNPPERWPVEWFSPRKCC